MDLIAFSYDRRAACIGIALNGRPLEALAREVEAPYARREGNVSIAGSYAGLSRDQIDGRLDHFLGTPVASWFADGDTVLMGCDCGEWGCWPLTARVDVTDTVITWSAFRNGHRDNWDLRELGTFEFDREQYEEALATLRSSWAR